MKYFLLIICIVFLATNVQSQFVATEVGTLPERVTNNAVCEGFVDEVPYLFSFAGIDSTKIYSGIHLKSFRYNIETGASERIADLPDELGKIGVGASRIGNIIYIAGGYNVFANGTEKTTSKMHRYDINNNVFLSDATDIPVPTDDHVQAVWRDSLIYLITGWNDTANIPDVQIYNPALDEWMEGTAVPNLPTYKAFGASGVIKGDTIYFFGGARDNGNFGISNRLRIGIINPDDPTDIEWSITTPASLINGYRMAATTYQNELHWIGGSNNTYNYNALAYDGSGTVSPNKRDLYLTPGNLEWQEKSPIDVPMDLRGIANISDSIKYIAGGMLDNREVTNKVYKLEWKDLSLSTSNQASLSFTASPNPFNNHVTINSNVPSGDLKIFDIDGQMLDEINNYQSGTNISFNHLPKGIYVIQFRYKKQVIQKRICKIN